LQWISQRRSERARALGLATTVCGLDLETVGAGRAIGGRLMRIRVRPPGGSRAYASAEEIAAVIAVVSTPQPCRPQHFFLVVAVALRLTRGERGVCQLLAVDRDQAAVAFRYARAFFEQPSSSPGRLGLLCLSTQRTGRVPSPH
jgi:hypothetical protein